MNDFTVSHMTINKLTDRRSGQTLIEAIVALSILLIGMVGILSLLARSLLLQRVAADQNKATYLAAEGIEVAKNLVDHNMYGLKSWNGSNTCFDFAGGSNSYYLDFQTYNCPTPANNLHNGAGEEIYFSTTNTGSGEGLYYTASNPNRPKAAIATPYSRIVTVSRLDLNTIDVISKVTWGGPFGGQVITLEDVFYNWRPNQS